MFSARNRVSLSVQKVRRSFDFTVSIVKVVKLSLAAGLSFFQRLLIHHNRPSHRARCLARLKTSPEHLFSAIRQSLP